MSFSGGLLGASLFGAIAGAVGLSLLTLLAHWLWDPRVLYDGQYGMVFMLTIPCGGWLGIATGLGMVCADTRNTTCAGWICLVAGAVMLVPALLLMLMAFFSEDGLAQWLFWFGLSAAWAAAMIYRGIQFLHSGSGVPGG